MIRAPFPYSLSCLLFLCAGLLLGLLLAPTQAQAGPDERIILLQDQITVRQDGLVSITETIRFKCGGDKIAWGLDRRFTDMGQRRVSVTGLLLDGEPCPFLHSRDKDGERVRLGKEEQLLEPGVHEFTLSYDLERALTFTPTVDRLNWSVTGHGFTLLVDKAEAVLELPPLADLLDITGYTGAAGTSGRSFETFQDQQGRHGVRTTNRLYPGDGLGIKAVWTKGFVRRPGFITRIWRTLTDNFFFNFGLFALLAAVLLALGATVVLAFSPDPEAAKPAFRPPPGLSPSELAAVLQSGRFDPATIPPRALAGELLLMRGLDDQAGLRHLPTLTKDLARASTLGTDHQAAAQELPRLLTRRFRGGLMRRALFTRFLPVTGLVLLSLVSTGLAFAEQSGFWLPLFIPGLAAFSLAMIRVTILTRRAWGRVLRPQPGSMRPALGLTGLFLPMLSLQTLGLWTLLGLTSPGAVGLFLGGTVVLAFCPVLARAHARRGPAVLRQANGFLRYLRAGPAMMLAAPFKPARVFEQYLPYALALGLEQAWLRRCHASAPLPEHVAESMARCAELLQSAEGAFTA